jgi:acetylglutamate kinase
MWCKPMAEIRSVVKQVLSQLGASREARHYLGQFSGTDSMRFAVVKVGGGVIEEQLEALASALAFLRNLGLMPIILHGAGPQLDAALEEASIITVKRDGLRVTTPAVMEILRPVILSGEPRHCERPGRAGSCERREFSTGCSSVISWTRNCSGW